MPPRARAGAAEDEDLEDEDFGLEDELDDEEEEAGGRAKRGKKGRSSGGKLKRAGGAKPATKKRGRTVEAATGDGDDDDDDDDEEDGQGDGRRDKKKKRNMFIDDIADVDDDEEEEEDDEEAEDLIDDRDVEIPEEANAAQGHASYRTLNREREDRSAEEIAAIIEERYKSMEEGGYGYEDAGVASGAVGQQAMQPTVNDPKLWLLSCRPGHEREAVTQLLQKYYTMHRLGTPLLIKSAIALDHLKGYIYVEAEKEAHVRDAIRGLRTVFVSKGVRLVPLDQMVEAISVNRKARASIARDMWVRMRAGLYKDDLARVVEVDHAASKATLRLVPRIDLQAMATRDEEARRRNPFNRGPVRPPARPFNPDDAREAGLSATRATGIDGQPYYMLGSQRFVGGYLERDVAFKSLTVIEGMPPVEDLQAYNACGAAAEDLGRGGLGGGAGGALGGDLSALVAALPSGGALPKTRFLKGDRVRIVEGELKGIEAIVDTMHEDGKVIVRVINVEGFNDNVDFDNDDLRKEFKVGDRVHVVSGPYSGETGIVLQVAPESDQCTLVSDTTRQEVRAFGRDCTTTDVTPLGVEALGEYLLHDLVQLDQHTAGVIIGIQRDAARVLTSVSTPEAPDVRVVRGPDIQRKLTARNLLSTDVAGNQVRAGDYVTFGATSAAARGLQAAGAVEFVWRGQLFVKVKDSPDTGGFVCVRANKCKVRGGANSAPSGIELARQVASGALRTPGGSSVSAGRPGASYMPASPSHYTAGGGAMGGGGTGGTQPTSGPGSTPTRMPTGMFRPPPPRMGGGGGGFSGAVGGAVAANTFGPGRPIRVVGGQYNGYKGRVKHETGTHVQLELDAISGRVVTVEKRMVRIEGAGGAAPGQRAVGGPFHGAAPHGARPYDAAGARAGPQQGGAGAGLAYGSRTPLHPSQTPMHPSMTPAHYSMTPSHAPYTPMHAPTPSDDNYRYGGPLPDDRYRGAAHTPAAFTPAESPAMYTVADAHAAPTPSLADPGSVGPPPVAGTPGLAPTPGMAPPTTATPYLPAQTPAITPGADLTAATPGMDGLGLGVTPGLPLTPHLGSAATPHTAATPGFTAPTPGFAAVTPGFAAATPGFAAATPGLDLPADVPMDYALWEGVVVQLSPAWGGGAAVVRGLGAGPATLLVAPGHFPSDGANFQTSAAEKEVPVSGALLITPAKKDRVRVLLCDQVDKIGGVGTLVGSMGAASGANDCIVRLEGGGSSADNMCIADLAHVGKMAVQTVGTG